MQATNEIRDRKITAVIFDMDNTLFDFVEAKLRACDAVVKLVGQTNFMELVEYFLQHKKGIENLENIADYLRDNNLYTDAIFQESCELYEKVKLANIAPYDGISETLSKLKALGLKLAVVTDASEANARARLAKVGLSNVFEVFVSADMTGTRKPDPDALLMALDKLGIELEEAVLVGDSLRRDIEPAKMLGMTTVYAAYGDRNFLEWKNVEADYVINDIRELVGIIEG
ncbi:MAG: HAD family hydrolase [Thermoplasmata archaeon]|nr:HAD family hydrolase [Thermoplasmata archaeon]